MCIYTVQAKPAAIEGMSFPLIIKKRFPPWRNYTLNFLTDSKIYHNITHEEGTRTNLKNLNYEIIIKSVFFYRYILFSTPHAMVNVEQSESLFMIYCYPSPSPWNYELVTDLLRSYIEFKNEMKQIHIFELIFKVNISTQSV